MELESSQRYHIGPHKEECMAKNDDWKDWEESLAEEGISLETRKNRNSGILQTRVTGVVKCPSDKLWKTLTTPSSYMEMMPKTLESDHLEEKARKKELVCYQRLDGGPSSDRDYTLFVTWTVKETKQGKKYHREWKIDNESGPDPVKGVVRVDVNEGNWTLTPMAGKKTKLQQVSYFEPGGSLWAMVANPLLKEGAKELFRNLKEKYPD